VEKRLGNEDNREKPNSKRRGRSCTSNERGSALVALVAPPPPRVNVCVLKPGPPNVKTAKPNVNTRVWVTVNQNCSVLGPPPKLVANPGPNAFPPPPKNILNKSSGLSSPSKRAPPLDAKPDLDDIPPKRSSGSLPLSNAARFCGSSRGNWFSVHSLNNQ